LTAIKAAVTGQAFTGARCSYAPNINRQGLHRGAGCESHDSFSIGSSNQSGGRPMNAKYKHLKATVGVLAVVVVLALSV
jgi:hypothetical protein